MELGPIVLPTTVLKPAPAAPTAGELATRSRIDKTARDFEASFLSIMLNQMFEGVSTGGTFGGGDSEKAFRSFMTEAMGQSMAKTGSIGLADQVRAQLLKLQGLS